MAFENLETVDGFAPPGELCHVDELVVVAGSHHHHVHLPARHLDPSTRPRGCDAACARLDGAKGRRAGAEAGIRRGCHESVRACGCGCEKRHEGGACGPREAPGPQGTRRSEGRRNGGGRRVFVGVSFCKQALSQFLSNFFVGLCPM
jgi:hypothetical protein